MESIEEGSPDWLRVALLLRPGTDAASALSLDFAVARALPGQPENVLSIVSDGYPLSSVCRVPFIEDEEREVQWLEAAVEILELEAERGLQALSSECLALLTKRPPNN